MNYKIESDFEYKGCRCIVIFGKSGHRCGYVGVNKNNRFYGKGYADIEGTLGYGNCHGGLTYSSNEKSKGYPVESDLWWFGFDCAHHGDGIDLGLAMEYFPESIKEILIHQNILSTFPTDEPIRTKEYVEENCKSLANQLV